MIKCKVCGCEFTPVIDKHYITRDNGESGISTAFKHVEGNLYDTFDCPACGCQIVAQERKRTFIDVCFAEACFKIRPWIRRKLQERKHTDKPAEIDF